MDLIYNLGYYLALFVIPFVLYILLFKKNNGRSIYTGKGKVNKIYLKVVKYVTEN